jgi:hypothetical protein
MPFRLSSLPDLPPNPPRRRLRAHAAVAALVLTSALTGCVPEPEPYPHRPAADIRRDADRISERLDAHIRAWLDGKAPAAIPQELIPDGFNDVVDLRLARPEQVRTEDLWVTRLARPIDRKAVLNGLPDANVTYLFFKVPFAPNGHRLIVEGEFPHARFFSWQITPPQDGIGYYPSRYFGSAEVPMTDADIEPLPGHVNPYRVGADRNAGKRGYRAVFELRNGDPVALNPMFKPPYRARPGDGNRRVGSLLIHQGPWGKTGPFGFRVSTSPGEWEMGALWGRIYAPDRGRGPFGGVGLPRAWFETPRGERYVLLGNAAKFEQRAHATMPARVETPADPKDFYGPNAGWGKSFGIVLSILEGSARAWKWSTPQQMAKIRAVDLGATGRGENQTPPHNYEPHATTATHNTYLGRFMSIGEGKVAVLTGRMPRFPDTRRGAATMTGAQVRYWSMCGYDNNIFAKLPGSAIHCLMDDEVTLDADRRYVIVYSRAQDRPRNANARAGATWVDWGPTNELGLMMRWMTIRPEWSFDKSPDELNLPWRTTALSGTGYDPKRLYVNDWSGFMGDYLPRVHYMTRAQFEALGPRLKPAAIPVWTRPEGNG